METSMAKRSRLEHHNAKEQLKTSESSATETKIKNVSVPELPNEIWLEILSYLSTYDVLKNVAGVSKRFHKLSEDPYVIRKIEVDPAQFWPKDKEEIYCFDFLGVLKRSVKLRSLSFGFGWHICDDKPGQQFWEALPSMNHQFLNEICFKGDGKIDKRNVSKFLAHPLSRNIMKYLEKCPGLKVLKFEFKPPLRNQLFSIMEEPEGGMEFEGKLKNLQEFHLIGVVKEYTSLDFEFFFGKDG